MPQLSRMGDKNNANGAIVRGSPDVFANGIAVGLHISPITPHAPNDYPHSSAKTTDGSPSVFANGCPVIRVGSGNTCGHTIVQGSPDVFCP